MACLPTTCLFSEDRAGYFSLLYPIQYLAQFPAYSRYFKNKMNWVPSVIHFGAPWYFLLTYHLTPNPEFRTIVSCSSETPNQDKIKGKVSCLPDHCLENFLQKKQQSLTWGCFNIVVIDLFPLLSKNNKFGQIWIYWRKQSIWNRGS